jgi:CMP-N-acetylneuraminic acid synthetase
LRRQQTQSRKNIRRFAGKPIIAIQLRRARCRLFDQIFVSTDDTEIVAVRRLKPHSFDRPRLLLRDGQDVDLSAAFMTSPFLWADDLRSLSW